MLSEELNNYLLNLKNLSPEITEIWLFGSRANGNATAKSDWDFFVFGDEQTFKKIKNNPVLEREKIDLFIVHNDNFSNPFDRDKSGTLSEWNWMRISDDNAIYIGTKWSSDITIDGYDCNVGYIIKEKLKAIRVL